jgi:hypothetical protein
LYFGLVTDEALKVSEAKSAEETVSVAAGASNEIEFFVQLLVWMN